MDITTNQLSIKEPAACSGWFTPTGITYRAEGGNAWVFILLMAHLISHPYHRSP
jgi:hypothetical protein